MRPKFYILYTCLYTRQFSLHIRLSISAWAISYRLVQVYMDTKCVLQGYLIFFVNNLCSIWNPFKSFVFHLHGLLRIAMKSDTFPNFKLGQYSAKRSWSSCFSLFKLLWNKINIFHITYIISGYFIHGLGHVYCSLTKYHVCDSNAKVINAK